MMKMCKVGILFLLIGCLLAGMLCGCAEEPTKEELLGKRTEQIRLENALRGKWTLNQPNIIGAYTLEFGYGKSVRMKMGNMEMSGKYQIKKDTIEITLSYVAESTMTLGYQYENGQLSLWEEGTGLQLEKYVPEETVPEETLIEVIPEEY